MSLDPGVFEIMIDHRRASRRMMDEYVIPCGVKDSKVVEAMIEVPRHLFVEEAFQGIAYGDKALPIGDGQSISRPCMVAKMTEALSLEGGERVLEIGGGSAYQSAILSRSAPVFASKPVSASASAGFVFSVCSLPR